jgi:salicylate synthase
VPVRVELADSGHYRSAVAAAVAAIRAGELEKVILSRTIDLGDDVDLPATYLAGREANTPARSFLLSLGGLQAAGFSPEIVAAVDAVNAERRVTAQPLAGTRALTGRPESDADLRSQLLTDPKEVYEHAISVRAVWDELAAVCLPDTVRVERYMAVQERGSVQHLGSLLSGRLPAADPMAAWRAFQALFPSVTATGIAKGPARRLIADLEPRPRRLYAGAVLTADHDGALDAALSLRAMYRERQRAWLQAGAGIVRQSDPEREHEETCEKLRSIADFLRERPRSA